MTADEVTLERSIRVALLLGVGGVAMFGVGMWLRIVKFEIVGAGLFAGGLGCMLDRRTILAVATEGIRYTGWGKHRIPWAEFAGFRLARSRLATFLQLVPKEPDLFVRRMSALGRFNDWVQRSFPQPRFGIAISHLAGPVDEVIARIRARLPEMPAP